MSCPLSGFNIHLWAMVAVLLLLPKNPGFILFSSKPGLISIHQWTGMARREEAPEREGARKEGDSAAATHLLLQSPVLERDPGMSH